MDDGDRVTQKMLRVLGVTHQEIIPVCERGMEAESNNNNPLRTSEESRLNKKNDRCRRTRVGEEAGSTSTLLRDLTAMPTPYVTKQQVGYTRKGGNRKLKTQPQTRAGYELRNKDKSRWTTEHNVKEGEMKKG